MEPLIHAAILAAGLGTRMKSKTAKVLHRAGGLCLAEYVVRAALPLTSPERIHVVVGHQADRVKAVLAPYGVSFAEQAEQLGTGHAVMMCRDAKDAREGYWLVAYGDCPLLATATLRGLLEAQQRGTAAATLISACPENARGYGRLLRDGEFVKAIVEEKAATAGQKAIREVNAGIYCFDAGLLWKHIEELRPNPASGEIYLTDIVETFVGHGLRVAARQLEDPREVLGINDRVELAEVDQILRDRKARELMLDGVTIERPDTVSIDCDVTVGRDTIVGPFAQLLGRTRVGEDCQIGAGAMIRDSVLDDGSVVPPFTLLNNSRLERGEAVGCR
jgi:bifunctional UDP-N-acetylglucosamine pyrophosphorylase / glucosamine-1-phosphate N-acetyltransferase